jgi:hypothetical protein
MQITVNTGRYLETGSPRPFFEVAAQIKYKGGPLYSKVSRDHSIFWSTGVPKHCIYPTLGACRGLMRLRWGWNLDPLVGVHRFPLDKFL